MPSIHFRTTVDASAEDVYAALATQHGRAGNWTDQLEVPEQTGGRATDSGDAYAHQTRSDEPMVIRGRLAPAPRGAYVVARREFGASSTLRARVAADGRFTLPTVRRRKQANNSFVVSIHDPPHALRKVRFSAICLDCMASGSSSE